MIDAIFWIGFSLLLLSVPLAIVLVVQRASRRNASTLGVIFLALTTGFITAVLAALVGWFGLLILWGLSV